MNSYILFRKSDPTRYIFGNGQRLDVLRCYTDNWVDYYLGDAFKRCAPLNLPNLGECLVDGFFEMSEQPDGTGIEYEALFQDGQLIYLRKKQHQRKL